MIFDVKLDTGFMRKSSFVADDHKFDTPPLIMYSLVASMYIVIIVLILTYLIGINLKCSNVQNAYLNAKTK